MQGKSFKFNSFNTEDLSVQEAYKLLVAGVSPRPIALVSTLNSTGQPNLAPFSFFSAFGANPPVIGFSPTLRGKDATKKDTLLNLEQVPECVVQVVPFDLVQQVSLSSTEYEPTVDEFVKAGLTPIDSETVRPKRVLESPFQMECKLLQIISLGNGRASGNLVLCEVKRFHIRPEIMEAGAVNPDKMNLVGRNMGNFYTRASGHALFEVVKPIGKIGIGIDSLPLHIRQSQILSANNLGQLGGADRLPGEEELRRFIEEHLSEKVASDKVMSIMNTEDPQNLLVCAISLEKEHEAKGRELFEVAAVKDLEANRVERALMILCTIPHFFGETTRES